MAKETGFQRISVKDNGPWDSVEHIFEAVPAVFLRRKHRGQGSDWPVVQKIIVQHGGQVEVRNRAEGGAEFIVTLPLPRRRDGSGRIKAGKHLRGVPRSSSCSGKVGPYASEILGSRPSMIVAALCMAGLLAAGAAAGFFRATNGRSCGGCRKEKRAKKKKDAPKPKKIYTDDDLKKRRACPRRGG